jgi:hypothetical protein
MHCRDHDCKPCSKMFARVESQEKLLTWTEEQIQAKTYNLGEKPSTEAQSKGWIEISIHVACSFQSVPQHQCCSQVHQEQKWQQLNWSICVIGWAEHHVIGKFHLLDARSTSKSQHSTNGLLVSCFQFTPHCSLLGSYFNKLPQGWWAQTVIQKPTSWGFSSTFMRRF